MGFIPFHDRFIEEQFHRRKDPLKGWVCAVDMDKCCVHIVPRNDVVNCHELDPDCACGPKTELLTDHPDNLPDIWMYTHQALDGRD